MEFRLFVIRMNWLSCNGKCSVAATNSSGERFSAENGLTVEFQADSSDICCHVYVKIFRFVARKSLFNFKTETIPTTTEYVQCIHSAIQRPRVARIGRRERHKIC